MDITAAITPQTRATNRNAGSATRVESTLDQSGPSEPEEAYLGRTSEAAEATRSLVSGVSTVGTIALTVPMAVVGGGVVGTAFGMGLGPAVAAVTAQRFKDFVRTSLSTTGSAAGWGMATGGTAALASAIVTGRSLGEGAAFVMGAREPKKALGTFKRSGLVAETAVSLFAGAGAVSGALGGGLTRAGLVATGSLLTKGFSLNGLGTAAMIGGGVGALFGLVVSGRGSYARDKGVETGIGKGVNALKGLNGNAANQLKGINLANLPKPKFDVEGVQTAIVGTAAGAAAGGLSAIPLLGCVFSGLQSVAASDSGDQDSQNLSLSSTGLNILSTGMLLATANPVWMLPAGIAGGIAGANLATAGRRPHPGLKKRSPASPGKRGDSRSGSVT